MVAPRSVLLGVWGLQFVISLLYLCIAAALLHALSTGVVSSDPAVIAIVAALESSLSSIQGKSKAQWTWLYRNAQCLLAGSFILVFVLGTTSVFTILGKRSVRMEKVMNVDSSQPLSHGLMVGCTLGSFFGAFVALTFVGAGLLNARTVGPLLLAWTTLPGGVSPALKAKASLFDAAIAFSYIDAALFLLLSSLMWVYKAAMLPEQQFQAPTPQLPPAAPAGGGFFSRMRAKPAPDAEMAAPPPPQQPAAGASAAAATPFNGSAW